MNVSVFRNYEFLNILLNNIFKLMPVEILQYGEGQTKRFSQLFTTKFSTSPMGTLQVILNNYTIFIKIFF